MKLHPEIHRAITLVRNKPHVAAVVVGLLMSLIFVYYLIGRVFEHSLSTDPVAARRAGAPLPVISVVAKTGSLHSVVGGDCIARANQTAALSSELGYQVIDVAIEVGDRVRQGQVLVEFDPTDFNEDLEYAERTVAQAKKLMDDIDPFFADLRAFQKKSAGPPVAFQDLLRIFGSVETRELDLNKAIQERTTLKRNKTKLSLRAPFDGVVTSRNAYPGQRPQSSEELVVISSLDPLELICSFTEDQYLAITTSENTEVTFSSNPGQRLEARFKKVLPLVDSETRSLKLLIELMNPDTRYLPGMHAVARLSKTLTALRIPAIATINPNGVNA